MNFSVHRLFAAFILTGLVLVRPTAAAAQGTTEYPVTETSALPKQTTAPPNPCLSNPCANGAACQLGTTIGTYVCNCVAGFTGATCQTAINYCSPNPCQNGGTCTGAQASYTCNCPSGWTNVNCQTRINYCLSSPCVNGGSCTSDLSGYTCACVTGYSGSTCATITNNCLSTPCKNGGACTSALNSYTCSCTSYFNGPQCQYELSNPCLNPQQCNGKGLCTRLVAPPYFTCTCNPGYFGDTCFTASPCLLNANQCTNRGTCSITPSSPYYVCNCYSDYSGTDCSTLTPRKLYPFGKTAFDSVLLATDDGSSPRISLDTGFLLYGSFVSSAYVNMNGYISFDVNYMSGSPSQFPLFNGINADIAAAFWADADSSGIYSDCCGYGVVYYQLYKFNPNVVQTPTAQLVLDLANRDGKKYVISSFSVSWVFVATWSQIVPMPYFSNQYSTEKSTFQIVLAMDNLNSKSYISFRYGNLNWNSARPAQMGIQCLRANQIYNYASSVSQLATTAGLITNEIGVNLFLSSGTVSLTPSLSCLKWVAQQKPKITSLLRYSFLLPPCPCSAFQAMFSPFHFWVPNTNCFMSSVAYYFTAPNFMAMKCCYDTNYYSWTAQWYNWRWSWTYSYLGNLITTPSYDAGGFYEFNPYYQAISSRTEDQAKKDCCIGSANCGLFYSTRPIDTCFNYMPPRFSSLYGDPHIVTLDGFNYDYNGVGEYWAIKSIYVSCQARTAAAWDASGNPVSASVFSAFAVQVPSGQNQTLSDRAFLEMNAGRTGFNLYVIPSTKTNKDAVNLTRWLYEEELPGVDYTTNANYSGIVLKRGVNGSVTISALGTMFIFRLEAGQISIVVVVGENLFNNTEGLLGIYDSDQNNDLKIREGRTLPLNSSSETIYNEFGESWRTRSGESIMWYPETTSQAAFQNPYFTPVFTPTFTPAEEAKAQAICGSNKDCRLDFAATKNDKVAAATSSSSQTFTATSTFVGRANPVITGPQLVNITVNQPFTVTYTSADADGQPIALQATGLPSDASFNNGVLSWTPSKLAVIANLSISGIDSKGIPALAIAVGVFMCDCSGHGSCDFASATPVYNSSYRYQLLQCSCSSGYTGDQCATPYDFCAAKPCGEKASCFSRPPGNLNIYGLNFDCSNCPPGQNLTNGKCIDVELVKLNADNNNNLCTSKPCQNNADCVGNSTSYTCTCAAGYTGQNCETDANPCLSNPCFNQGTCSFTSITQFTCSCAEGFQGTKCETAANTCPSNPCQNGAACLNDNGNTKCLCVPGYNGTYCETVASTCSPSPCQSGATCVIENAKVKCLCLPGYSGVFCDAVINNCLSTPCKNGGTCANKINSFSCTCPAINTGAMCQNVVSTYVLNVRLNFKIGVFTWSPSYLDPNSTIFKETAVKVCSQLKTIFAGGVKKRTFYSCSVVRFYEGSVVFDGVTSFTSLGTDPTSSLDFANDIRQTVLASLSNSNPTGIISTTLKVSVPYAGSNVDPCSNKSCPQICSANSSTEAWCNCYPNFNKINDSFCQYALPQDNGSTTVIALVLSVVIGATIIILLAYTYFIQLQPNKYSSYFREEHRRSSQFPESRGSIRRQPSHYRRHTPPHLQEQLEPKQLPRFRIVSPNIAPVLANTQFVPRGYYQNTHFFPNNGRGLENFKRTGRY